MLLFFTSLWFLLLLIWLPSNPGSTKFIWQVQKLKLVGDAVNKKGRPSYDLLMLWSYDPEWYLLACASGMWLLPKTILFGDNCTSASLCLIYNSDSHFALARMLHQELGGKWQLYVRLEQLVIILLIRHIQKGLTFPISCLECYEKNFNHLCHPAHHKKLLLCAWKWR